MNTLLRSASVLATVGFAAALSTTPASAVTGSCSVGNVTYSLTDVAANDANNVLCFEGQPDYSGPEPITETFFGMEYTLSFKSDEAGKGTNAILFDDFPTSGEDPLATWSITDPAGIADQIVIGFKQANSYAAFLISSTSGTWGIEGPGESENVYSHVDIWYKPGDIEVIPLPASLPLLLAGLSGLGFLGWSRRRA